MNRSRSPQRRDSRPHSHRSRSPHRSHKHESSSRRSRSPNHHRPSDRRRSPSPPSARQRSGGHSGRRSSNRSDSSDGSRERGRRRGDDRSSRSGRDRNASPDRSGRSGHYDRRSSASDSRAGDRPSSSADAGRSRQSRWESEPVAAPAPPPSAVPPVVLQPHVPSAPSVVSRPHVPSPIAEKPSQTVPSAAAADGGDAVKLPFAAPAVPLQPVQVTVPLQPVQMTVPLQPVQMTRIYVGNVYRELSEDEIQTVFEAFGPIRSCKFIPNPENGVGKHKGFGFIDYVDPAAAASAVQAMNGFTLAGRAVKVGWAHSASLSSSSSVDLHHVAAMCAALHPAQQALQTHVFLRAAAAAAALVNKQNGL